MKMRTMMMDASEVLNLMFWVSMPFIYVGFIIFMKAMNSESVLKLSAFLALLVMAMVVVMHLKGGFLLREIFLLKVSDRSSGYIVFFSVWCLAGVTLLFWRLGFRKTNQS